jgi:hypothetical protein
LWRLQEQFPLEREIQGLTETNLQELFDLIPVKSEFELHGLRIDTLAFDKESSAFVIIEYKKDRFGLAPLTLAITKSALSISEAIDNGPDSGLEICSKKTGVTLKSFRVFTNCFATGSEPVPRGDEITALGFSSVIVYYANYSD